MLLIITNRNDFTADFLITRLLELNKPYFRFNSEDIPDSKFLFSPSSSHSKREITIKSKKLDLTSVQAVWYRRKIYYPSTPNSEDDINFIGAEVIRFMDGLIACPAVLWVNPPHTLLLAENKVYQLRLAAQIGFDLPKSIISNEGEALRKFMKDINGEVICKPIFRGLYSKNKNNYAIYTSRIQISDLLDDQEIQNCPVYLQEEIPKGVDVRVTFIGKKVWPVEITYMGSPPIDWRSDYKNATFKIATLPKPIKEKCRKMMEILGIKYAAFDFVLHNNSWYFLEVNPTGEWAWLERTLGLPMRDALIELFHI